MPGYINSMEERNILKITIFQYLVFSSQQRMSSTKLIIVNGGKLATGVIIIIIMSACSPAGPVLLTMKGVAMMKIKL